MPRRNRVDPWGDLHAVPERGMFTGNRGCLVDEHGNVVRHHRGSLWIACVTEFRDRRWPLARPNRWTPIFFLDDAVALAAGHRPCGYCRRELYLSYRDAVTVGAGATRQLRATELDRRLAAERLMRGSGISRAAHRRVWRADMSTLPVGAVVVGSDERPRLVLSETLVAFEFAGWTDPIERPDHGMVDVLTPPTSVLALSNGYVPVLATGWLTPAASPDPAST